jgi:hypothetical protein
MVIKIDQRIRKIAEESGIHFGTNEYGEYCDFYSDLQSVLALKEFSKRLIEEYVSYILNDESGDIDYIKWKIKRSFDESAE